MRVDGHVPRGARQRLALSVGDVLLCLWVAVLLRHAEVDDVYNYTRYQIRAPTDDQRMSYRSHSSCLADREGNCQA